MLPCTKHPMLNFLLNQNHLHNTTKHHLTTKTNYIHTATTTLTLQHYNINTTNNGTVVNNNDGNNTHALVHLIRASTDLGLSSYGTQLHCHVLKNGFGSDLTVATSLMGFYRGLGSMENTHKVFDEITEPSVVSWNCLISGYVKSGQFRKALGLFIRMERCSDAYSFTSGLSACGQAGMAKLGRSIHCKVVKFGMDCEIVIGNCLIDMYGKCGFVEEAVSVFGSMVVKDIISWNSVIGASASNGRLVLAFEFLCQMPNPDTVSYNALINGIAQFGNIEEAMEILLKMPNPDSSSWNSIITGYVNRNRPREALEFFSKMHSTGVRMDEYTYSILLCGIAGVAALSWGRLIHCCAIKPGLDASVVVGSALIDMYAKCAQMNDAESVFQWLPKRNMVTWNALISGYAHNGYSRRVIELFKEVEMLKDLKPDYITFLNVIAACSHSEVPFEKVVDYFESMINVYGIEPTIEHCCSMIRIMGQKSAVWLAGKMIYDFAFGSFAVVWRALLGACITCGNLKVANIAAAKVIQLQGDDDYVYVAMSNLLARHGKWGQVSKVRKFMREIEVWKEVGHSWIQVEHS